ncbi:MAG: MerR family transcriptional regulator [Solirubrobacteraceae bacterium]
MAASATRATPARLPRASPRAAGRVYSIGAVASMVGLPPPALRTWEERYGVVSPDRTRRALLSRNDGTKVATPTVMPMCT